MKIRNDLRTSIKTNDLVVIVFFKHSSLLLVIKHSLFMTFYSRTCFYHIFFPFGLHFKLASLCIVVEATTRRYEIEVVENE